jgi:hypothetical protein
MLYQLSYASSLGQLPFRAQTAPSAPCVMSGTRLEVITTAIHVQPAQRFMGLLPRLLVRQGGFSAVSVML